jgi:ubiquinol-cytochrome c reductase cytochrome c1 subunit
MIVRVRSLLFGFLGLIFCANGLAASEINWDMEAFEPDLTNIPSLQKGFKVYVNYCLGCHSLKYQRYERTADDLMIPHDLLESAYICESKERRSNDNRDGSYQSQVVVRGPASRPDDGD